MKPQTQWAKDDQPSGLPQFLRVEQPGMDGNPIIKPGNQGKRLHNIPLPPFAKQEKLINGT